MDLCVFPVATTTERHGNGKFWIDLRSFPVSFAGTSERRSNVVVDDMARVGRGRETAACPARLVRSQITREESKESVWLADLKTTATYKRTRAALLQHRTFRGPL